MIEIEKFLQRCKLGQSAFNIEPYNAEKIDTEIGKICFYMKKCDTKSIIDFWKSKDKNEYLELEHPLYRGITTRAVFSLSKHIFFIDENNKHPWVLFQSRNIIDCILVENKIYTFPSFFGKINFDIFNSLSVAQLKYNTIPFKFALGNAAFWHYFFDLYGFFLKIESKKKVINVWDSSYFISKNISIDESQKQVVSIYPHVIRAGRIIESNDFSIFNDMADEIYKESINDYSRLIDEDNSCYDLKLWVGLTWRTDDRKTWINQLESIILIVEFLMREIKKIKIYFDGFRSYENGKIRFGEGAIGDIITIFKNRFEGYKGIKIVFLHGENIRKSICCCSDVDLALVETGSGAFVPSLCCKKPSILYGNSVYMENFSKIYLNHHTKPIEKNQMRYYGKKFHNEWDGHENYFISGYYIYNEICRILGDAKKLVLKKINLPDVDILLQQYKLNQYVFKLKYQMQEGKNLDKLTQENNKIIQNKDSRIELQNKVLSFQAKYGTAKSRIQNQLSYKLGQAMVVNSKSLLGYIRMPFVLSYIKDKHKQEQKIYQEKIKKDPFLKLPPLEDYPDYKEALKEKECFTYKLGQVLIQANKTWYKGGYIKLWFEIRKLKSKFIKK